MKSSAYAACILALALLAAACDILRTAPFEVETWTPGEGCHVGSALSAVALRFSHTPDRPSVERALSLTEDGIPLSGSFAWEGRTLRFRPHVSFADNRDYRLSLGTEAQDGSGLSLDVPFEGRFTTRSPGDRPRVLSTVPADGSVVDDPRTGVSVTFSREVSEAACRDFLSFSPSRPGTWKVENGGRTAVFLPTSPWDFGFRYVLSVPAEFPDRLGRTLGAGVKIAFTVGSDQSPPELSAAYGAHADGSAAAVLIPSEEVGGWERDYRLRLDFSEPVDIESLRGHLSLEPPGSLTYEVQHGLSDSVLLVLPDPPPYGSRFAVLLSAGVEDAFGNKSTGSVRFPVLFDGPRSAPPVLAGIRLPLAPGAADPTARELAAYDVARPFADLPIAAGAERYPFDVPADTWVEFYFDLAQGAEIDLFSLMELLRIEATNGALTFSPYAVSSSLFSVADPQPEWAEKRRIQVQGRLTNRPDSGIVTFHLGAGLRDTAGNRNGAAQRLPLLK